MKQFPFDQNIHLENERVLLRPLESSDHPLLLPFSENEPELWEFALVPARNAEELTFYIEHALQGRKDRSAYPFLIIDKKEGKVAGSTRFYAINEKESYISIGFTWIGKAFQGTGLNRSMKSLMLDYTFNVLKTERLEFRADAQNKKSIGAIESIGAKLEGILRSNCYKPDGGRRDSAVLSILRKEFTQLKD